MKRKILFTAMLSLLTAQAFSMEITKGKLISHKEWTTDKRIVGHLQELKLTKSKAFHYQSKDVASFDSIKAKAEMPSFFSNVNTDTTLHGDTIVDISNYTEKEQTYNITREICTYLIPNQLHVNDDPVPNPPNPLGICFVAWDVISLDPSGRIQLNQSPTASMKYAKPGVYQLSTEIQVGRRADSDETLFSSSADSTITVTADQQ
jgi:hypothetical protein